MHFNLCVNNQIKIKKKRAINSFFFFSVLIPVWLLLTTSKVSNIFDAVDFVFCSCCYCCFILLNAPYSHICGRCYYHNYERFFALSLWIRALSCFLFLLFLLPFSLFAFVQQNFFRLFKTREEEDEKYMQNWRII